MGMIKMRSNLKFSKFFKVFVQVSLYSGVVLSPAMLKASDIQIYSGGTAGGTKTFVMMLDNSGSMASIDLPAGISCSIANGSYVTLSEERTSPNGTSYSLSYCAGSNGERQYTRLSNIKIAMFALMNTVNIESSKSITGSIELADVVMGVGSFPAGSGGMILVPAKRLGPVGSDQRKAIEVAIRDLQPTYRTPTALAYSTAAAHLMGTSTAANQKVVIEKYLKSLTQWSKCTAWNVGGYKATCSNWQPVESTPTDLNQHFNFTVYPGGFNGSGYYRKVQNTDPKIIENYYFSGSSWSQCSAWYASTATLKQCKEWNTKLSTPPNDIWDYYRDADHGGYYNVNTNLYRQYGDHGVGTYVEINEFKNNSPLPAIEDRKTCDGQGVYLLSDGEPNDGPVNNVELAMKNSLGSLGNGFSCPTTGGLTNTFYDTGVTDPNTNSSASWHCIGEYAKRLYDSSKNPQGVKFKTAFVGYGNSFRNLTNQDQINACKLGSAEKGDSCSPDATNTTLRNDSTGYGLGGYTYAQTSNDVINSIVKFIDGLNGEVVSSLSTGAWAVPVDTLNPTGLQPHAYMRILQPEPGTNKLSWIGNLKKYHLVDGVLRQSNSQSSSAILNSTGQFAGPSDAWSTTSNDGGNVTLGGAYAKVPLPFKTATENHETNLRRIFTDVTTNTTNQIVQMGNDTNVASDNMLKVVERDDASITNPSYILDKFKTQDKLKYASNRVKRSLLNYLGYSLDINDLDLPTTLTAPAETQNAMSGIIHSLPLQLTYEGDLDDEGILGTTRKQYTLFGTMEGGLRLVNAANGVEQMTFIPGEILLSNEAQVALKPQQSNTTGLAHGVDAPWIADAAYESKSTTSVSATGESVTTTAMKASRMNVYGGLRMGGESYYGLDLLNPKEPKFLFRIGRDQANFARMGQSWSKPVVANIRYQGKVRRVVIVGGGYDKCYEDPRFTLKSSGDNSTCTSKTKAQGNAVYIVDAQTGTRLWWTSDTGSNKDNAALKHSIVSSISTADGNSDGLVDHLYFGDLGGQVFRIDLDNNTTSSSTANSFATRVVKLADLATKEDGTSMTNGDNPRFYEAPTITVHRDKSSKFILVGLAAGDRSSPLDVAPSSRIGLPPLLTDRPVNNVYGLMDIDAVKPTIMKSDTVLETQNLNLSHFIKNPGVTYTTAESLISAYAPYNVKPATGADTRKFGWYRSLSSTSVGVEKANGVFRKPGGLKAFEAPIAITGNLIVSVYDPESSVLGYNSNPCEPRIIGETYRQYYCLPFGACMSQSGGTYSYHINNENNTGYQDPTDTTNTHPNKTPIGVGIQGNVLAPKSQTTVTECGALQLAGITTGTGEWTCSVKQQPLNWYSSSIRAN